MGTLLAGSAWRERQFATGSSVRSVFSTAVDSETAKCTVFFGTIGRPLSAGRGFHALYGSGGLRPRVYMARRFVRLAVDVIGVGFSAITASSIQLSCSLRNRIGSHVIG